LPQVHLHVATVAQARAAGTLPRYLAGLDQDERARHARMRPDPRGDEFLVGRALLRHALSRHTPGGPWRFAPDGYGCLALVGAPPDAPRFNLSHAAGLVVCAVADVVVGVDVERVDERRTDPGIWQHYFAPAEVAALTALPEEARTERFFTYWTLKEAYIKARGLGVSIPLHHFWFPVEAGPPLRIAFAPELADDPARWRFAQQRLSNDFLLAVAASAPDEIALSIHHQLP
jgi:4'-phosphopantetheinyl transferase